MVDELRVHRLLRGIEADTAFLARFVDREIDELVVDEVAVSGIKYRFITAIEGCAKVAHHLGAAEEWTLSETNADAVRRLGLEGVLTRELAGSIADAVGFRNLLVHQYGEVDDRQAIGHLARLDDLREFIEAVATWLDGHTGGGYIPTER